MAVETLKHTDISGKCFSVSMSDDLACEDAACMHPRDVFAFGWPALKACCSGKDLKALTSDCVNKNEFALRASALSTAACLPSRAVMQSCR